MDGMSASQARFLFLSNRAGDIQTKTAAKKQAVPTPPPPSQDEFLLPPDILNSFKMKNS